MGVGPTLRGSLGVIADRGGDTVTIVGSITPDTHLPELARALSGIHSAVLEGRPVNFEPRPVVARSWERVLGLGLEPEVCRRRDPLPREEIARRRAGSGLAGVVDELAQVIGDGTDRNHMLLVVTDAEGVILWREGSSKVRRHADSFGFMEGAIWTEAQVGTNAIGTALAEQAPVQLFSAEHFERVQHAWYCTATPIHDPVTGELMGIVDVSGPAMTLHPAIEMFVEATRRLAEARILRRHAESLESLRRSAEPLVAGISGAAVVVDEQGWVAMSRGVRLGPRLSVPSEHRTMKVPGMGLCTPHRLEQGWLLLPAEQRSEATLLHLDLSDEPVIEVAGESDSWRSHLSKRHAEILILLAAAGPEGLSAAGLSRALFGDAQHCVTVRAEISRLRRTLGEFVWGNPYRLAPGITFTTSSDQGAPEAGG